MPEVWHSNTMVTWYLAHKVGIMCTRQHKSVRWWVGDKLLHNCNNTGKFILLTSTQYHSLLQAKHFLPCNSSPTETTVHWWSNVPENGAELHWLAQYIRTDMCTGMGMESQHVTKNGVVLRNRMQHFSWMQQPDLYNRGILKFVPRCDICINMIGELFWKIIVQ